MHAQHLLIPQSTRTESTGDLMFLRSQICTTNKSHVTLEFIFLVTPEEVTTSVANEGLEKTGAYLNQSPGTDSLMSPSKGHEVGANLALFHSPHPSLFIPCLGMWLGCVHPVS